MIIDAYAHVFPQEVMDGFRAVASTPALATLQRESNEYQYDVDARLRYLDQVGIDKQVLVLSRPPVWLGLDPKSVSLLVGIANDGIARVVEGHPDRFAGVGVIPIGDKNGVAEVQRIQNRGLKGALVFTNCDGAPLDSGAMREVFTACAEADLPVWLHPQNLGGPEWLSDFAVDRILGWPFGTSVAMVRLVMSGVVRDIPRLRMVTHHLGAMVPYFARRIVEFAEERQQWHSRGKGPAYSEVSLEDVSAGLKSFYSDTALNGAQDSLVCGIAHFGVGHVLFGTDFPFGPDKGERWPRLALESVSGLEIGQGDREAILSGNAARLLYGT